MQNGKHTIHTPTLCKCLPNSSNWRKANILALKGYWLVHTTARQAIWTKKIFLRQDLLFNNTTTRLSRNNFFSDLDWNSAAVSIFIPSLSPTPSQQNYTTLQMPMPWWAKGPRGPLAKKRWVLEGKSADLLHSVDNLLAHSATHVGFPKGLDTSWSSGFTTVPFGPQWRWRCMFTTLWYYSFFSALADTIYLMICSAGKEHPINIQWLQCTLQILQPWSTCSNKLSFKCSPTVISENKISQCAHQPHLVFRIGHNLFPNFQRLQGFARQNDNSTSCSESLSSEQAAKLNAIATSVPIYSQTKLLRHTSVHAQPSTRSPIRLSWIKFVF